MSELEELSKQLRGPAVDYVLWASAVHDWSAQDRQDTDNLVDSLRRAAAILSHLAAAPGPMVPDGFVVVALGGVGEEWADWFDTLADLLGGDRG